MIKAYIRFVNRLFKHINISLFIFLILISFIPFYILLDSQIITLPASLTETAKEKFHTLTASIFKSNSIPSPNPTTLQSPYPTNESILIVDCELWNNNKISMSAETCSKTQKAITDLVKDLSMKINAEQQQNTNSMKKCTDNLKQCTDIITLATTVIGYLNEQSVDEQRSKVIVDSLNQLSKTYSDISTFNAGIVQGQLQESLLNPKKK